jgi:hypothetical protein
MTSSAFEGGNLAIDRGHREHRGFSFSFVFLTSKVGDNANIKNKNAKLRRPFGQLV